MSYIGERVSYLKGLAEGMGISDQNSNESKLLLKIIEVLEDISDSIDMQDDALEELAEYIDDIDEDLSFVEDYLADEEDLFYDDDDEDDFEDFLEVSCPHCEDTIFFDADALVDGELICPSCGKDIIPSDDEE